MLNKNRTVNIFYTEYKELVSQFLMTTQFEDCKLILH